MAYIRAIISMKGMNWSTNDFLTIKVITDEQFGTRITRKGLKIR